MSKDKLRQEIILCIKSVNKHLTDAWIKSKSTKELVVHTHPIYRDEYKRKLGMHPGWQN